MIAPEIIDRLKRDQERDDRPSLQIPIYAPEIIEDIDNREKNESAVSSHIIVIDLM